MSYGSQWEQGWTLEWKRFEVQIPNLCYRSICQYFVAMGNTQWNIYGMITSKKHGCWGLFSCLHASCSASCGFAHPSAVALPWWFSCPQKGTGHILPRKERYWVVPHKDQLLRLAQQWGPTVTTTRQWVDVVPSLPLEQNGMPTSLLPADEWRILCTSWPIA